VVVADPFGKYAGKVTIKGGSTSRAQRQILARAIAYADKVKAPYQAKIAVITALIQESEAKNLGTPSADGYGSYGVLQGLERYHNRKNLMNPEYQFGVFFGQNKKYPKGFTGKGNAISLAKRGMSPGNIAQAVEGSAYPDRYATTVGEAKKILRYYRAGSGGGSAPGAPVDSVTGGTKAPSTVTTGQDIRPLVDWIKNRHKGATVVDLANAVSAAKGTTTTVPTTQGVDAKAAKAAAPRSRKSSGSPGKVYELFYDPQGGWKMGTKIAPIGGHSDHVHVAADERRVKWIGKQAQKMGLRVGEHRAFSGSTPTGGHAPNSYHYKNEAIDVSGDSQKMADFTRWVRRNYNLPK
jgi:hypothetical protein